MKNGYFHNIFRDLKALFDMSHIFEIFIRRHHAERRQCLKITKIV